MQEAPSHRSELQFARWCTLALVVLIVVIGVPRLSVERPIFRSGSLIQANGSAPVPQDDANPPAVDRAFAAAATFLLRDAICVISQDSWNRDYFRASYVLMPRRVWPVAPLLAAWPPSARMLARAAHDRHATCLLVSADVPVPSGWHRATDGAYALYLPGERP